MRLHPNICDCIANVSMVFYMEISRILTDSARNVLKAFKTLQIRKNKCGFWLKKLEFANRYIPQGIIAVLFVKIVSPRSLNYTFLSIHNISTTFADMYNRSIVL